eukprot:5282672-Pleurochrysis_carterae.AAC.2
MSLTLTIPTLLSVPDPQSLDVSPFSQITGLFFPDWTLQMLASVNLQSVRSHENVVATRRSGSSSAARRARPRMTLS